MQIHVEIEEFNKAFSNYIRLLNRDVSEVVKEQAGLLAERLQKLTYPKSPKQGKDSVKKDIERVFQRASWFQTQFPFRNQNVKKAIVGSIERRDATALRQIFDRSSRLSRLKVEPFDPSIHARSRDSRGRVRFRSPVSFPIDGQKELDSYIKKKQANVGNVRAGWATCAKILGRNIPNWLNRPTMGSVRLELGGQNPNVTLMNHAPTAESLMNRTGIVGRALEGRARDMTKQLERLLEIARRNLGL